MARNKLRRNRRLGEQTPVVVSPPELTPKIPVHEQAKNLAAGLAPHVRRLNRFAIAGVVVAVLVIPFGKFLFDRLWCSYITSVDRCAVTASVTSSAVPSGSFVLLGTNTFASQQPTAIGKSIATLMPWNGKIYMGYGDYGANTGPVHIMSYDPLTGDIADSLDSSGNSFTSSTEAIYNFRAINGTLYGLALDPKGSQCGFMYAKTTDGVHWQDVKGLSPMPSSCPPSTTGDWVDAEHVMDMNTLDGTDLWVSGSALGKVNVNGTLEQGITGAVWHSTNNGVTWTKMIDAKPHDYLTNTNDYTRIYPLGVLNGKLYTQAWDVLSNVHQPCQAYDGTAWSTCPDMSGGYYGDGWRPISFAGKLVYEASEKIGRTQLKIYDGISVSQAPIMVTDIAVDDTGKTLYAIDGSTIYATTDLTHWTQLKIAGVPANATSVAVANNILYLGAADSSLYATSLIPPVGPAAVMYPAAPSGNAPFTDTFYANGSTGGTSVITSCVFDFGDGTKATLASPGSANHTYATPGTYTASVTVTDANGLTSTTSQQIAVLAAPPTASLSLSATHGSGALAVTARASGSVAGTYPIADYMFDFGDGTTVGPQAGSSASHTYTRSGAFTITLTVRDVKGSANTATEPILITPALPAYVGQYYPNTSLSGSPVITRRDPSINFNWGTGSPGTGMPADKFSVRWTRTIPLDAGTYKFTTTTDDGVRLYIDGALVINQWKGQSVTTYSASIALGSGNHTIKMEYFDWVASAVARMTYSLVSRATPPFLGQYFANSSLAGTPAMVRNDPSINFNWGTGSPESSITADNFSVRWTQTPYFATLGTYRFQATADDGVRLYIDNQLVIDHWTPGASTNYGYKQLAAGYHTIRMEYYEGTGNAQAQLTYYLFDLGTGAYEGSYWNNTGLSGTQALARSDSSVNFNWGTGSPASSVHVDNFSARWTKIANFAAGNHTFTVTSDDGVRLYIDDVLAINEWKGEPPTSYSVTRSLMAGSHKIRMEYFEGLSGATARLSYN